MLSCRTGNDSHSDGRVCLDEESTISAPLRASSEDPQDGGGLGKRSDSETDHGGRQLGISSGAAE